MVTIRYLADHLEVIPTLAEGFRAQWPDYFANWTLAEIELSFREDARRQGIPVRLVAFDKGVMAGTIVLRDQAIQTQPEYSPALGGLYVLEKHRRCGIGTELVRTGMDVARRQGFEVVYATTVMAAGILERLGWVVVKELAHDGEQLTLYRYAL
jgi:predicted N-acetyltransferase YhbS